MSIISTYDVPEQIEMVHSACKELLKDHGLSAALKYRDYVNQNQIPAGYTISKEQFLEAMDKAINEYKKLLFNR